MAFRVRILLEKLLGWAGCLIDCGLNPEPVVGLCQLGRLIMPLENLLSWRIDCLSMVHFAQIFCKMFDLITVHSLVLLNKFSYHLRKKREKKKTFSL